MLTKVLNCAEDASASELLLLLREFEKKPRHGEFYTQKGLERIAQELSAQKPGHPSYHRQWYECYRLGIVWGAARLKGAIVELRECENKLDNLIAIYPTYWSPIKEKLVASFILGKNYGEDLAEISDEQLFADALYQLLKVQPSL